jgi:cytochrome P450
MKFSRLDHIPGPRGLEFFEMMLLFQKNSLRALEKSYKVYGPLVSYPWPVNTVLIFDPKLIKQVLIDKKQIYKKGDQTGELKQVLGEGLVTNSDRPSWLRNRTIVSKEMGPRIVQGFSSLFKELTLSEMLVWPKEGDISLSQTMRTLTFKIAGQMLLGSGLSIEDAKQVDEAVEMTSKLAHDHMFQFMPTPYWIPTSKNREFKKHLGNLDRIVLRLLNESKEKGHEKKNLSLLERLVLAKHPETGEPLDQKNLRDEVLTLLIAGYETTYNSLCWTLALIASTPDVKKKIQGELEQSQDVTSMEFTKTHPELYHAILEGLRLYTAIPMSSRKSTAPDQLGDFELPAGVNVIIPAWVIHRDPLFWPDPIAFRPERWNNVDPNQVDAYVPFSKGSRRCVGEAMAMVEMAVIISTIMKNFEVALKNSVFPEAVAYVSLRPDEEILLRVKKK